jgi:hypothetical protein
MTGTAWAMALRQRTGRRCCSCARTSWGGWGHLMEPTLVRIGFGHVVLRELNLFDSSSPLPRTLFQHAPALPAGPEKAVLKESRDKPFNSAVYAQIGGGHLCRGARMDTGRCMSLTATLDSFQRSLCTMLTPVSTEEAAQVEKGEEVAAASAAASGYMRQ